MIVVDCSVVVDALTVADGGHALRARLGEETLHAPALIDYEVAAAVRGLVLRRDLAVERAEEALADFGDLPIRRWPAADALRRRALALREDVSAYDAAYVVLAEALDCPLLTRDVRLARAPGHDARVEVL
ncbi:type II toxin-antitoxin system VapC family toxin [Geodermatophilus sp. SYSU D00703]